MRRLVKILLIGLSFLSPFALAEDATVTWTHPTQYVDNTPIPAGGLSATEIQYGKCNATRTGLLATPVPVTVSVPYPTATRIIVGLTGTAEWCFQARSMQPVGTPSDWTGYAWKLIDIKPKPPVLSSTITVAYETWRFLGKTYLGRSVGTIPLGLPCGEVLITGRNYYEIDRSAVALTKQPNSGPVVTQCAAG